MEEEVQPQDPNLSKATGGAIIPGRTAKDLKKKAGDEGAAVVGTGSDKTDYGVETSRDDQGVIQKKLINGESESEPFASGDQGTSKEIPTWNCRVEGTPADGQWTVGEVFYLFCEGERAELLSSELTFKEEKKSGYELKILEVTKQTDNEIEAKATSYIPAQHEFENLVAYDQDVAVFKVSPINLAVKSVIKDPQQQPYAPILGMKMGYPVWIWIALAVTLLVTVFLGLFRMNRRAQMRKVIEELKQHNTALGAFNQFNKDVRTLGRQYIFGDTKGWSDTKKQRYVESLDEVFRMYLLREFYVPALDWSSNLVLKTISNQDKKRYGAYGDDLQKFLKELDRAKEDTNKLKVHDCKQLTQMAKRVTQSIWKVRKI